MSNREGSERFGKKYKSITLRSFVEKYFVVLTETFLAKQPRVVSNDRFAIETIIQSSVCFYRSVSILCNGSIKVSRDCEVAAQTFDQMSLCLWTYFFFPFIIAWEQ